MKIKLFFLIFISIISLTASAGNKKITFDTKDSDKWVYIIKNKSVNYSSLFIFENNILKITDESAGYLRTPKEYKNFTLDVEWRWTKVKANSGVLVHIQQTDSVWPVCYQVQQKADAAGDIICMNGLKAKECTDTVKFTISKMSTSNENQVGEWNKMRIISKKGTLTVFVNGKLQNKITGLSANKGFIGFQAEGKPLEFRNLSIR